MCGLPAALSLIETAAARLPVVVGVKTTLMEQLALGASELPQLFDWLKSELFAPDTVILVIANVDPPVLLKVEVFAALDVPVVWLPKSRLAGLSDTAGGGGLEPPPPNGVFISVWISDWDSARL
jgi:hypothetical protein